MMPGLSCARSLVWLQLEAAGCLLGLWAQEVGGTRVLHTGLRARALLAGVGVRVRALLAGVGLRARALLAGVGVRARALLAGVGVRARALLAGVGLRARALLAGVGLRARALLAGVGLRARALLAGVGLRARALLAGVGVRARALLAGVGVRVRALLAGVGLRARALLAGVGVRARVRVLLAAVAAAGGSLEPRCSLAQCRPGVSTLPSELPPFCRWVFCAASRSSVSSWNTWTSPFLDWKLPSSGLGSVRGPGQFPGGGSQASLSVAGDHRPAQSCGSSGWPWRRQAGSQAEACCVESWPESTEGSWCQGGARARSGTICPRGRGVGRGATSRLGSRVLCGSCLTRARLSQAGVDTRSSAGQWLFRASRQPPACPLL
ncbi:uncharacterized protein C20orf204 homolog isoform X1 [Oryctolagus cuniculus]|uniref:uncharacterized protein C20orf204 homolog isoform X1 n=1 Tax=Oryctolagus cuniculus TaxID=9986 RepID=UPI003879CF6C